jgi:hypothetical protein
LILVDPSGAVIFNSIGNGNQASVLKALNRLLQDLFKSSNAAFIKQ